MVQREEKKRQRADLSPITTEHEYAQEPNIHADNFYEPVEEKCTIDS